ncbi:hypothetical protein QVA66_09845 [Staphylococcus chromogenes]|nr:hypothetical protein [Staphylococcus chromogenes]
MTSEELLILAREVARLEGTRVRSLPALCALAGLTRPYIGGVPVFRNHTELIDALRQACLALRPLETSNEVLAHVIAVAVTDSL